MSKHASLIAVLTGLVLIMPSAAGAQEQTQPQVTIVPGPQYEAGWFGRLLLGDNWRGLWTTPVRVPVLDLGTYAGGLEMERQGGGNQSRTLHMVDASGHGWVFRSVDKFPEQGLPDELDGSLVGSIIGDQISGLLPAGALIMPRLLEAAGILHVEPMLYVMPDDPRLGEFRATFAGMLGGLEFKPNEGPDDTPGWADSRKIRDSRDVLDELIESPDFRVDEREFLRARLIDFLVGDTDRGTDQWRWARFGPEGDYVYRPIPRDRDWAFVRTNGLLVPMSHAIYPKTTAFGDDYPSVDQLTFSSHILDRRLLTRLTHADFAHAASTVQSQLTDAVIDEAVAALPPEYEAQVGDELREHLVVRRAGLPAMADAFYAWLASDVDVHGTDEADHAEIERRADGTLHVRLSRLGAAADRDGGNGAGEAYYERTFLPSETDEVRVFLHAADDIANVVGEREGSIEVRVLGGTGSDRLEDATGTAHFYDRPAETTLATAAVDTTAWYPPEAPEGFRVGSPWAPDWGIDHGLFSPAFDYGEGGGLIVGGGPEFTWYGFRRIPYALNVQANALYAIGAGSFGATANVDYRFENSPLSFRVAARAVAFDAFRFYGFGNDTPDLDTDVTLVMQDRVWLNPAYAWHIGPRPGRMPPPPEEEEEEEDAEVAVDRGLLQPLSGEIAVGAVFQWTRSEIPEENPLRAAGTGARLTSGQVGVRAAFELGRTDGAAAPRRGFRLRAEATTFPVVWEEGGTYGTGEAQLSAYLPLIGDTHVAGRVGGAGAFGDYPVYEAAFIGGRHSLRGFRSDRFAGDAALYGGVELRVPVGRVPTIVNGELGVFGLADVARVWHDGATDGGWHTGLGGGLWYGAAGRAVSAAYAHGESGRLYLWAGLPF
jgi:Omp85 superfamily domain